MSTMVKLLFSLATVAGALASAADAVLSVHT